MKNKFYYNDGATSSEYYPSKALHRTDGPAMEYASGYKAWWVDGKRHRTDGPAVETTDGSKYWFINSVAYGKGQFNELVEEVKELPLALRLIDPREWVRKL